MPTTLGLDLGPNSVGWALVDADTNRIIDLGVRIFPEGVDNFDSSKEKPRNEDRRNARTMRRQIRRRAERRKQLRQTLIDLGLFPADAEEQRALFELHDSNPYALRAKALDEKLTLHELGRVLLHLNQRRGFRSNKKSQGGGDKELKGMLGDMSALEQELQQSGIRTYGEYLFRKTQDLDHTQREQDDHIRGRHTQRRWITGLDQAERERVNGDTSAYFCPDGEFDAIWKAQQKYYPDLLTDQLAYGKLGRLKGIHKPIPKDDPRRKGLNDLESFGLFGLLFFHRTLKPVPREIVGNCELESKKKRCHRADRAAQRFRLLQEINNLRLIDNAMSPPAERSLNDQERALVLDKLAKKETAKFDDLRKWIGKLPDSPAEEQIRFNLEEGKRKSMKGMVTDVLLAKKDKVGAEWHAIEDERKDAIVRCLIDSLDDDETHTELIERYGLTPDQADGALGVDLTDGPTKGYVNFSRVAIEKLMPYLEKGMRLMANDETDSAIRAAGYMRRDELQRRIFDKLPDPARSKDAPISDIPNPVVKRAIVELRKVVNAIIREYGRPDAVHVEMAREVRQSPKQRGEYNRRIREIEAERDEAKQFLQDHNLGYGSRGSNILRVQLWKQQNHNCPYCGQKISQGQLFSDGQVDIDHILPYSRSLDDSQMNKVVCHRECNVDKGNQTPYEWLSSNSERYERVCQYAFSMMRHGNLPYRKYKRFTQKELKLDDFIARQLTATGYIGKATVEYLKCLFENEHDVLGLKGQLTAELRRQWGLNDALRSDGVDAKTRDDHRHHAVDALVIAMTDRSRLQALSKINKRGGVLKTGEALDFPWDHFRDDAIAKLNMLDGGIDEHGQQRGISHRVQRKVAGALHEETVYSPVNDRMGRVEGRFVVRKSVEALSANEVGKIRDDAIRKIVLARLAEFGIEVGRGKKPDPRKWKEALGNPENPLKMSSGVPIKKVRILREEQTIQPIRTEQAERENNSDLIAYVKPGSTHHLCIFEFMHKGKKKRDAVFVTQLEATNRLKRQQQELNKRLTKWKKDGLGKHAIKRKTAQAMREIAVEYPLIQRDASKLIGEDRSRIPAEADFVMSLSQGELVLADWKGEQKLLKFKTAASTSGQMWFAQHIDARKSTEYKKMSFSASTLTARKITIDPLGRVRWAND